MSAQKQANQESVGSDIPHGVMIPASIVEIDNGALFHALNDAITKAGRRLAEFLRESPAGTKGAHEIGLKIVLGNSDVADMFQVTYTMSEKRPTRKRKSFLKTADGHLLVEATPEVLNGRKVLAGDEQLDLFTSRGKLAGVADLASMKMVPRASDTAGKIEPSPSA